jgi:hypothetical protein
LGILRLLRDNDPLETGRPDLAMFVHRRDFDALARRVSDLERAIRSLESAMSMRPMNDSTRYYSRPTGGEYGDITGFIAQAAPWVSNSTRVMANLIEATAPRRTLGEALLLGASFTIMAGLAALWADLPWTAAPVIGLAGMALSASVLVIHNRTEWHRANSQQAARNGKRRREMRVTVGQEEGDSLKFLYLNSNVNPAQLKEFAGAVLDGSSLAVHKWTGQGALFTRGQYDDLMTELEKMHYVCAGAGNVPRVLTFQGRALMRGLAERRPPAAQVG